MLPFQFLPLASDPDADKIVVWENVLLDNLFSSPKQIRWSAGYPGGGKLLVANGGSSITSQLHARNSDLSFFSKYAPMADPTFKYWCGIDSDSLNTYAISTYDDLLHKCSLNFILVASSTAILNARMIDASGDPLHVYVTSNNAADGHGIRMITKSTMTVTSVGGNEVKILATGTGDNQFTNPLGVLFVSTGVGTGNLFICEATRICKIAVVTTAGSESLTWTTSYAIAANDLTFDGTNFYAQSNTTTKKCDASFDEVASTACVGYSITYIPDQGDGNGATLGIVNISGNCLYRRKCSDLSLIATVGSYGDGSSSLFDPTFTTDKDTTILATCDDGISQIMTKTGSAPSITHALSLNGFAAAFHRTPGPHKWTFKVNGGLGLVTRVDNDADAVITVKNFLKLNNCTRYTLASNPNFIVSASQLPRANIVYLTQDTANLGVSGSTSDFSANATELYLKLTGISDSIANFQSTVLQYLYAYLCGVSAGSIAKFVAAIDFRFQSNGWLTADVDTVLRTIPNSSYATPTLSIGGTNQAPSGAVWQQPANLADPATWTGLEAIWVANHKANPWQVTFNGGISEDSLLGNVIGTGEKSWATQNGSIVRIYATKFVSFPGTIGDVRVKSSISANVKVGIYSDNSGKPGTLLGYGTSAVIAGWNIVQLNISVLLTATNYWLVFKADTAGAINRNSTGTDGGYLDQSAYSDALPASGISFTVGVAYDCAIAGWGLKVV